MPPRTATANTPKRTSGTWPNGWRSGCPGRVLALGTRDFSKDNVPFKSRAGNWITSVCFFLACRARLSDTQTGLRAFPSELLDEMLSIEGDRYEYEMRMLAYAAETA